MGKQMTIRGISPELGNRLNRLSRDRGQSLNATVLEILESALGVQKRRQRLERYATWSEDDRLEFEKSLSDQRRVDEELWR